MWGSCLSVRMFTTNVDGTWYWRFILKGLGTYNSGQYRSHMELKYKFTVVIN
jgi:hypothetical protein